MIEPDDDQEETPEEAILSDASDMIEANIRSTYWSLDELGVPGARQEFLMSDLLTNLSRYKPLAGHYGQRCAREDEFEASGARGRESGPRHIRAIAGHN
jgi:hypothetical protein